MAGKYITPSTCFNSANTKLLSIRFDTFVRHRKLSSEFHFIPIDRIGNKGELLYHSDYVTWWTTEESLQFPAGISNFSLLYSFFTGSGTHPGLSQWRNRGSIPMGISVENWTCSFQSKCGFWNVWIYTPHQRFPFSHAYIKQVLHKYIRISDINFRKVQWHSASLWLER